MIREYYFYAGLARTPALDQHLSGDEAQHRRIAYVMAQNHSGLRNWAYPRQVEDLLAELVEPLEPDTVKLLGCRARSVIRMWGQLRDRVFARLRMFERIRAAARANHRDSPAIESLTLAAAQVGLSQMASCLHDHSTADELQEAITRRASSLYTFALAELVECAGNEVSSEALQALLQDHALQFGALADEEFERSLYENPVWDRPIITTSGGNFFIPLPALFHSFAFRHLESLYQKAGLQKRYEERRAQFLELKLQALLRDALPSAQVFSGNRYKKDGALFENDVLLKAGNWLLVFEAKSNKLGRPAQRGAYNSLQDKIEKLAIEPSDQSAAFTAYLASHPGLQEFQRRKGSPNIIDTADVVRILRITVTLESLGSLGAQIATVPLMGLVPHEYRFAVTMNLFDLAVVLDTLQTEEERLDYLFRRADSQGSLRIDGEERDLLVFYIAAQMRAQLSGGEGGFLRIAGWRSRLDDYYVRPLEGKRPIQYGRQYTPLWRRLIKFIRNSRYCYWPEAATMLLCFTLEEQNAIEKEIRRNVSNSGQAIGRKMFIPGWNETFLICLKALREDALSPLEQMKFEMHWLFDRGQVDHALVVTLRGRRELVPEATVLMTTNVRPRWL